MSRFDGGILLNKKPSGLESQEENTMPHKPTRSKFGALAQICHWIPTYLVAKLARKHGADK